MKAHVLYDIEAQFAFFTVTTASKHDFNSNVCNSL